MNHKYTKINKEWSCKQVKINNITQTLISTFELTRVKNMLFHYIKNTYQYPVNSYCISEKHITSDDIKCWMPRHQTLTCQPRRIVCSVHMWVSTLVKFIIAQLKFYWNWGLQQFTIFRFQYLLPGITRWVAPTLVCNKYYKRHWKEHTLNLPGASVVQSQLVLHCTSLMLSWIWFSAQCKSQYCTCRLHIRGAIWAIKSEWQLK